MVGWIPDDEVLHKKIPQSGIYPRGVGGNLGGEEWEIVFNMGSPLQICANITIQKGKVADNVNLSSSSMLTLTLLALIIDSVGIIIGRQCHRRDRRQRGNR